MKQSELAKKMNKDAGGKLFENLVVLENKLWNRADYSEDDITTFSNAMDFIEANINEFKEYFKGEQL